MVGPTFLRKTAKTMVGHFENHGRLFFRVFFFSENLYIFEKKYQKYTRFSIKCVCFFRPWFYQMCCHVLPWFYQIDFVKYTTMVLSNVLPLFLSNVLPWFLPNVLPRFLPNV